MKTLAIILAALILPALCYIAWKWLQQKTLDFVYQEKKTKGYPTEEEEADRNYRGWKPKERR